MKTTQRPALKPETVARLAAEHSAQRIANRARLLARLHERAASDTSGLYAEMATELEAQ